MQIWLSNSQAEPGRTVKQEQKVVATTYKPLFRDTDIKKLRYFKDTEFEFE